MLVKDLRKELEKCNSEEKDKIIVELYKRIPKGVKEDYDIDNFILNIKSNTKLAKEEKTITIEQLEKQVNYFVSCAEQGLYASPNKVISKSERSKWRFTVRNFYKNLTAFVADIPEGIIATDLLKSLYNILSVGSCYLTFSNWETFRAIQISQSDFLEVIVKRKLSTGLSQENMLYCIELLKMKHDPYDSTTSLALSFSSYLKTSDMKYMAIELLKDEVIETKDKLKELKNQSRKEFEYEELNNFFTKCIVFIYFELHEIDKGIAYFHKNYIESSKEIKEFILLSYLRMFEFYNEWITEYEKHSSINYRDSLKLEYKEIKELADT